MKLNINLDLSNKLIYSSDGYLNMNNVSNVLNDILIQINQGNKLGKVVIKSTQKTVGFFKIK